MNPVYSFKEATEEVLHHYTDPCVAARNVLTLIRYELERGTPSRERALAITKIEEAGFWLDALGARLVLQATTTKEQL